MKTTFNILFLLSASVFFISHLPEKVEPEEMKEALEENYILRDNADIEEQRLEALKSEIAVMQSEMDYELNKLE